MDDHGHRCPDDLKEEWVDYANNTLPYWEQCHEEHISNRKVHKDYPLDKCFLRGYLVLIQGC